MRAQEGMTDAANIALRPGDRIFFPSRSTGYHYVFGGVRLQGSFPILQNGITLLRGLAQAHGPNPLPADMESIRLVRGSDKEPRVWQLSPEQTPVNKDLALAPGDRMFVPSANLANWDRKMREILALFSGVGIVNGLVINP